MGENDGCWGGCWAFLVIATIVWSMFSAVKGYVENTTISIKGDVISWQVFIVAFLIVLLLHNVSKIRKINLKCYSMEIEEDVLNEKLAYTINYKKDLEEEMKEVDRRTELLYTYKDSLGENLLVAKRMKDKELAKNIALEDKRREVHMYYRIVHEANLKELEEKYETELTALRDENIINSMISHQLEVNAEDYMKAVNSCAINVEDEGKHVGIYILKNLNNNKFYVSRSYDLIASPKEEFEGAGNKMVFYDYNKNPNSWTIKIIRLSDSEFLSLDMLEQYYKDIHNSLNYGYNKDE